VRRSARPAGTPALELHPYRVVVALVGRGVGGFPDGRQLQQALRADPVEHPQSRHDLRGLDHQVADEPLQVADQPVLVGDEGVLVDILQVDGALQAAHERAGVGRQPVQQRGQLPQQAVHHGRVRVGVLGLLPEAAQAHPDVLERHRLQLASVAQRLVIGGQRELRGFALRCELVEVAGPVEVVDRGDAAGVGVGLKIPPGLELLERRLHRGRLDRWALGSWQSLEHVLGSQVYQEAPLGRDEHAHDAPVQVGVGHIQVSERLRWRLGHRFAALGMSARWCGKRGSIADGPDSAHPPPVDRAAGAIGARGAG
jgi:hypothetical protein